MTIKHKHKVRVYYPDTDAGGIVYHGQYLNFLDQGRTEFLRHTAIDMSELQESQQLIFVVAHIDIKYLLSALMDDNLEIETELLECRSRSFEFLQTITLNSASIKTERVGKVLVRAQVKVVAVNTDTHKACRISDAVRIKFES